MDESDLMFNEIVKRLTSAMRKADKIFEQIGGSTRHHVRDCLLPILEEHGIFICCLEHGMKRPEFTLSQGK